MTSGSTGPVGPVRAGGIRSGSVAIDGVLVALSIAAVVIPAVVVRTAPPVREQAVPVARPVAVVPKTVLPPVEPTEFRALAPDDARAFNATVPFVKGPNPAARPFRFGGDAENLARATDCLAAAVLYEAGDDPTGQRAVAQVVLNRVLHPAYPKTVCGVVFQGSERRTGCQFTFTCDGALARTYPAAFRDRARAVAAAALGGNVFAPVGYATHYHTDWVVPYWQSSLDKIAAVDTHLFFRWTGWWGTPAAFRRTSAAIEPRIPQLAAQSDSHKTAEMLTVEQVAGEVTARFAGVPARASSDDPDAFLIALDPAVPPDQWPQQAAAACGDRVRCKFLGWRDATAIPATAASAGDPAAMAAMTFSYLRDRSQGLERRYWNCQQVSRPPADCMRRVLVPVPVATPMPTPSPVLPGVRRRSDPAPAASPAAQ